MRKIYLLGSLAVILSFVTTTFLSAQCALNNGIILVNHTDDEGPGSLRAAIECANTTPGPNLIQFNIASPFDQVFFVGETTGQALPTLTDPGTVIDGTTHIAFGLNNDFTPTIILDGSAVNWDLPASGLDVRADDCEIYGLEIRYFPYNGIVVTGVNGVHIGRPDGMNIIYGNGDPQDIYPAANPSGPYEGSGIFFRKGLGSNFNFNITIENNIIGTDENFSPDLGNEYAGIRSFGSTPNNGNRIGGTDTNEGNRLQNNAVGVLIQNSQDELISGNAFICNDSAGIRLESNANGNKPAPAIADATPFEITGTTQFKNDRVQVYVVSQPDCPDAPCQGATFLGEAVAGNSGQWTLTPPFANGATLNGDELITAIAIGVSNNTSPFGNCFQVFNISACADPDGVITVSNTEDEGPGSLREAIICANKDPQPNIIVFDIPDLVPDTLFVGESTGEPLPSLLDPGTIIDGSTQPVVDSTIADKPRIILSGAKNNWTIPHNALFVRADNCEIYGLEIIQFPDDAIDVTNASNVRIGRPGAGNVIFNNGSDVDFFPGLPGQGPFDGSGIHLKGNTSECIIQGNIIGTNYERSSQAGNELAGIRIQESGFQHLIGGNEPGDGNVIVYHQTGVFLQDGSASNRLTRNSIYCNGENIDLQGGANNNIPPPTITMAQDLDISGTGANGQLVEVYATPADPTCIDQCRAGRIFIGEAVVSLGSWAIANFVNPIPPGDVVISATTTSNLNNTSEFANCVQYVRDCSDFSIDAGQLNGIIDTCNLGQGGVTLDGDDPLNGLFILDIIPAGGTGGTGNPNPDPNSLFPGNYLVIISSFTGCTDTLPITIFNLSEPPTAAFTFTADSTTVTFTNASTFADTYLWDFGDSTTSTEESPTHTFPSTGIYEVCLQVTGPCGTDTTCQNVLVFAPEDIVEFDMGEVRAQAGDTVAIPVFVQNFEQMVGFQYSIRLADPNAGHFLGVDSFNLPDLNQGAFSVTDEVITCSWADFSLKSVNVPDSTIIFYLRIAIDTAFTGCSDVIFSSDPTPTMAFRLVSGQEVPAPFDTLPGRICVSFSVSGQIYREDTVAVGNVVVFASGQAADTTLMDGSYSCRLDPADPIIDPSKNNDPSNGVSAIDLVRIQQHIQMVVPLETPYKIIAADADNNGFITAIDLVILQQIILGQIDDFPPSNESWRFVPASYTFINPLNPLSENFPEIADLSNVQKDTTGVDFIGIKVGDVVINNNPQLSASGILPLRASYSWFPEKQELQVSVRLKEKVAISALQGSFLFDASQLQLKDIELQTSGLHFSEQLLEEGRLPFLWWDAQAQPEGVLFPKDQPLFSLTFSSSSLPAEGWLQLDAVPTPPAAYLPGLPAYKLLLEHEGLVTSVNSAISEKSLLKGYPNPFRNQLLVEYQLPSGDYLLRIFSMGGKMLHEQHIQGAPGKQQLSLDADLFPAAGQYTLGVYSQQGDPVQLLPVLYLGR